MLACALLALVILGASAQTQPRVLLASQSDESIYGIDAANVIAPWLNVSISVPPTRDTLTVDKDYVYFASGNAVMRVPKTPPRAEAEVVFELSTFQEVAGLSAANGTLWIVWVNSDKHSGAVTPFDTASRTVLGSITLTSSDVYGVTRWHQGDAVDATYFMFASVTQRELRLCSIKDTDTTTCRPVFICNGCRVVDVAHSHRTGLALVIYSLSGVWKAALGHLDQELATWKATGDVWDMPVGQYAPETYGFGWESDTSRAWFLDETLGLLCGVPGKEIAAVQSSGFDGLAINDD